MITRAWLAWKRVAHGIGTFRARGVLTSYFVVMLPFGIVFVVLSIWAWGQSSGADRYSTGPSLCLRTATSFLQLALACWSAWDYWTSIGPNDSVTNSNDGNLV